MTYDEALAFIHSVSWKGSRPGLSRIKKLCEMLGDPQDKLKFIHVTGTNGKGSTCAMTESILRHAGFRTGLFTSPYVRRFNERITICGEPVSDSALARVTAKVKPFAEEMEDKPTEFELITAIAFQLFVEEKCDIVVLEVGMGGRLDSTNVVASPLVSVITGVSLDHTAYLGDTIEKIAFEKAGIIKPGCPVLYCGTDVPADKDEGLSGPAYTVVSGKARELSSPLYTCDYNRLKVISANLDGSVFNYKTLDHLVIPLLGLYQPSNAVKALETVRVLGESGISIPEKAIRDGLSSVRWPARFEKLYSSPLVLYDGGHNPEGIDAAVKTIKAYFPERRVNILTGVMADKDYRLMASELSPYVDKVFTVKPDNPRSLSAEELAELYSSLGHEAKPYADINEAFADAVKVSAATGTPLICLGTLYMYSTLMDAKELLDRTQGIKR